MAQSGDELTFASAVELVELYRSRRLSPVEVTEAHLERIERLDREINSYITVTAERARERAKESELRYDRGEPLGSLDGVPFAPKDIYATHGIRTTAGSKLEQNSIPTQTATAVERLEESGAIMLGKLNLLEFATGSGTESGFGPTRNPWNLEYDSGGSSSGSGAAVAAGLATLSLGTDTGGSIRNPAGRCGIVGIKPTYGRVSRHGVTPLAWTTDHAGPMTRTVRDTARLLGVISGHDPKDASSAREPVPDFEAALGESASLRGKQFVVAEELMEPTEPEVRELVEAAISHLEQLGARRVNRSFPRALAANVTNEIIIGAEAAVYHEQNMADPKRRRLLDPAVRYYVNSGRLYLATDYVKAQRLRLQLQADLDEILTDADVLVCPTDPTLAPKIGEPLLLLGRVVDWFQYGTLNVGNLIGAPALSVPCGFTNLGLPVGLQMYGRAFEEATVLAFGHAYEQSTDWHRHRPGLS
jgi:aspartyl-tRNA(Asn)/glutamyl-tRNA(Gln) amidotransferase subunit A